MNLMNAINKYYIARYFYLHHMEPIAWIIRSLIYLIHNSFIPYKARIGKNCTLGYKGIGVVIHSDTNIGDNCVIGTNVLIGGGHTIKEKNKIPEYDAKRGIVPVIGNNVEISTGAKLLGNIVIGDNVIIGANAVVISDIPDNAVVAGVPAKIIRVNKK